VIREVASRAGPGRSLVVFGAALDVGEEEGDGAGRQIGHDPFQTLGEMSFSSIVACAETDLGWPADTGDALRILSAAPPC
jgi:hypothetical protein